MRAPTSIARGIPTSFGFLNQVAGFSLNQSVIPFTPLSSYGRALLVGLLNTLLVSALAGVLATFIGFAAGFARLSRNWALARLAGLYVETIRNMPLLLQILFWYVVILSPLPGPADSHQFAGFFLNNRGLSLPALSFAQGWPAIDWPHFDAAVNAIQCRGRLAAAAGGLRADLRAGALYRLLYRRNRARRRAGGVARPERGGGGARA